MATCSSLISGKRLTNVSEYARLAGSGKSFQALLLILKYIDDPNFRAVFIRQTSTQLSQAGGLFSEAQSLWSQFGAKFKSHPQMTAKFPSGAEVQFKYCASDADTKNFDGLICSPFYK